LEKWPRKKKDWRNNTEKVRGRWKLKIGRRSWIIKVDLKLRFLDTTISVSFVL
jgi:hypothetical protein